ncbi:MAG: PAS domain-containing protein [Erythrobacter sp.]|nr:PAS domain-containing protein [Erythrobacter sp.]
MPFTQFLDERAMPAPDPALAEEAQRLAVIERFELEALGDDPELQAIVEFAARLCNSPVSILTLLEADRQRFIARTGLDERETAREVAFCNYTLGRADLLEVPDAPADPRFADNPLVTGAPGVRYYAGQPLVTREGASLGTLCVIDTQVHGEPLNDLQRDGLQVLANAAMRRLEARRASRHARRIIAEREERLLRMIEGVPQIAWSADNLGNFDYFNRRWQEVTGAQAPKLAEDWRPFIHPDDATAVFDEWYACFTQGREFEGEYRLLQADGSWSWVLSRAVPVAANAGEPARWFGTLTDIDEVRGALEQRDVLSRELAHRIKNLFAVVIGLASLKARQAPDHAAFADELVATLRALSRAHEFVRPGDGLAQDSLHGLLDMLFLPYAGADGTPRIVTEGADCPVGSRAATPLALVFHELATNAAKYGALATDGGAVALSIADRGDALALTWRESGGPAVEDSGHRGFGSRLLEMSVTGQLQGSIERQFLPHGLVAELTVAKAALVD